MLVERNQVAIFLDNFTRALVALQNVPPASLTKPGELTPEALLTPVEALEIEAFQSRSHDTPEFYLWHAAQELKSIKADSDAETANRAQSFALRLMQVKWPALLATMGKEDRYAASIPLDFDWRMVLNDLFGVGFSIEIIRFLEGFIVKEDLLARYPSGEIMNGKELALMAGLLSRLDLNKPDRLLLQSLYDFLVNMTHYRDYELLTTTAASFGMSRVFQYEDDKDTRSKHLNLYLYSPDDLVQFFHQLESKLETYETIYIIFDSKNHSIAQVKATWQALRPEPTVTPLQGGTKISFGTKVRFLEKKIIPTYYHQPATASHQSSPSRTTIQHLPTRQGLHVVSPVLNPGTVRTPPKGEFRLVYPEPQTAKINLKILAPDSSPSPQNNHPPMQLTTNATSLPPQFHTNTLRHDDLTVPRVPRLTDSNNQSRAILAPYRQRFMAISSRAVKMIKSLIFRK